MPQYNSHITTYVALVVVFAVLALFAVILRFVARRKSKGGYGADDWLAVVALIGFLAFCGIVLWNGENGAGYKPQELPAPVLVTWLKGVYAFSVVSPIPPAFGRFSLLALYIRLFSVHPRFRIAVKIIFAANLLLYIACEIAIICLCIPIQAYWDKTIEGKCIDQEAFVVAAEVPGSLLDFIIVGLPLGVIKSLKLPFRHKVSLGFIFALGGFVGVIGFIRIAITYKPQSFDISWSEIWLIIQLGISVICCCLPTYRPLLPRMESLVLLRTRFTSLLRSRGSDNSGRSRHTIGQNGELQDSTNYINLGDSSVNNSNVVGAVSRKPSRGEAYPMDSIHVHRSVEVV